MEYYEVAAKWWTDQLRSNSPDKYNNGDLSLAGIFGVAHALSIAESHTPSEEALKKFQDLLSLEILKLTEEFPKTFLSCDYSPDSLLSSVAKQCGIDTCVFPWKTTMLISAEEIRVCLGYNSQYEVIYRQPQ